MCSFFYGSRRKAGCVTLLLACVFAAGWVRSQGTRDIYSAGSGVGVVSNEFRISPSGIFWSRVTALPTQGGHNYPLSWNPGWRRISVDSGEADDPIGLLSLGRSIKWRHHCCGTDIGEFNDFVAPASVRVRWLLIPFWLPTCMLTLLSAYLLIRKPRRKPDSPAPTATVNDA